MKNQAFTLIELLIAVLIIGILAAIAVPQYRIAVAKAKFSELKIRAKTHWKLIHNYYLTHGSYPANDSSLDILFKGTDIVCDMANPSAYFYCWRKIYGKQLSYYILKKTGKPYLCYVWTTDTSHPIHKVCKQDTNISKSTPICPNSNICYYSYK